MNKNDWLTEGMNDLRSDGLAYWLMTVSIGGITAFRADLKLNLGHFAATGGCSANFIIVI